jgi:hypothetical protein
MIGVRVVIWEGLLLKNRIRSVILGSLRFFIVGHAVFSTVGEEILAGGSVGEGWDQLQRAGPKDDRQVTDVGSCHPLGRSLQMNFQTSS